MEAGEHHRLDQRQGLISGRKVPAIRLNGIAADREKLSDSLLASLMWSAAMSRVLVIGSENAVSREIGRSFKPAMNPALIPT